MLTKARYPNAVKLIYGKISETIKEYFLDKNSFVEFPIAKDGYYPYRNSYCFTTYYAIDEVKNIIDTEKPR